MPLDFTQQATPFTHQELVDLGIVEGKNPEQDPAKAQEAAAKAAAEKSGEPTTPAPTPAAPAVDPSVIASLAESVNALHEKVTAAPTPEKATQEPEKTIEELLEEGDTAGAIALAQKQAQSGNEALAQQLRSVTSANAKQLFKQSVGDDEYNFWYPKMKELLAKEGLDESQLVTPDAWNELIDLTRARNMPTFEERLQAKMQHDTGRRIMGGSVGEPKAADDALSSMSGDEVMVSRAMHIDPSVWAKNAKILEKYDNGRGDIGTTPRFGAPQTGAPVIDDDFKNTDAFGDITVEPGRF